MSATTRRRSVKDFQFGNKIGEGSYSTVYKAVDVYSRKVFAIKILSKAHIVKEKKIKYVNIEKQTLNRLGHHPGIVTLYYTFQDESSLFFVIDFAEYGELLTLIRKLGSLNEVSTRYYMIQLIDAVKFMHSKGVIHRDLKPENILLNHDMKLMITDFGAAKMLDEEGNTEELKNNLSIINDNSNNNNDDNKEKAASFVGTAEYVSPELLQNNECGYESDIWAIGCILYQFIAGVPPFKGATEYLTFEKIIALDYKFPNYYIPESIKHLVKNILVIDPKKRYSTRDIQSHAFFHNVPWTDFNYIWKRNPPKIEAYDPRIYTSSSSISSGSSTNNDVPTKPKQAMPFYKKPIANPSKTLDLINNTYVPSSSLIMPGASPKKNLQPKPYPKINQFSRNNNTTSNTTINSNNNAMSGAVAAVNNSMGISNNTNIKPVPQARYNGGSSHLYQQNTGSSNNNNNNNMTTPPHPSSSDNISPTQFNVNRSHEKQTSNTSQSSNQSRGFSNYGFYAKPPVQTKNNNGSQLSSSQPSSPVSINYSVKRSASEATNHNALTTQDGSPLSRPNDNNEMSHSPIEQKIIKTGSLSESYENNPVNKTKDVLTAANEAIQSAQNFRAKNLFTTSNKSTDTLTSLSDSRKSSHPYASIRTLNSTNNLAGLLDANNKPPPLQQPPRQVIEKKMEGSPTSNSFSHFDKNQQTFLENSYAFNDDNTNSNKIDTDDPFGFHSPPTNIKKSESTKSLTLESSSKSDLSYKNDFKSPQLSNNKTRNGSITISTRPSTKSSSNSTNNNNVKLPSPVNRLKQQQACPSPIIYYDEDISPNYNDEDIPESVISLLKPDEQIIKMDTIVVGQLSFDDILNSHPDLQNNSSHGLKLNLNDNTINDIITDFGRQVDYNSKIEVMFVTTYGRLFILQSINLNKKLFEIKLTDNKISLYDYEFDDNNYGYLLVELIDKKCLLFLSPHDHKRLTIDYEINNNITWIECLFKAKQLLRPKSRKKSDPANSPTKTTDDPFKSPIKSHTDSNISYGNGSSKKTSPKFSSPKTNEVSTAAAAAAAAVAANNYR